MRIKSRTITPLMVALRCVMRIAWQVANPITALEPNAANRYPAAVLVP